MSEIRSAVVSADATPAALHARLDAGERLVIFDVRQPDEYHDGHIMGSKLIPLDQLAQRLDELPRDQPIMAVCRSGNRSGVAIELLRRAGFTASNVEGGMLAWAKQGLPMEREA